MGATWLRPGVPSCRSGGAAALHTQQARQLGPRWWAVTGSGCLRPRVAGGGQSGRGPGSPVFGAQSPWALGHKMYPAPVRLRATPARGALSCRGGRVLLGSSPPSSWLRRRHLTTLAAKESGKLHIFSQVHCQAK